MKQLGIVLFIMCLSGGLAHAKVTPEQAKEIGDRNFVAWADGLTTVADYIKAPLPLEICTPWVNKTVLWTNPNGPRVDVSMRLVYVNYHSSGPYVQFSTSLEVSDKHFEWAVKKTTQYWSNTQMTKVTKRTDDKALIVYLRDRLIHKLKTIHFVGLVKGTHAETNKVVLKCSNIPSWMVRSWPGKFTRIQARW